MFQVHLLKNEKVDEIYKLEHLFYIIVTVEKYVNKNIPQCFKCQGWHHGASLCKMNPKCVICAGTHEYRDCPNKNKENFVTKCANCGGNHTASYRGCPRFPKIKPKTNSIQPGKSFARAVTPKQNPTILSQNTQSITEPPKTWSSLITGNANSQTLAATPNVSDFSDLMSLIGEVRKIFNGIKDVKALTAKMQSTDNIVDKLMFLSEALRGNPEVTV
ncbi:hypothetical protein AVEN_34225-1 [Araneus ventricosus]|uniref:Nucleic-acid-binding protein from transposon X-element n=1 Tax=Araneus ventricosus TaxID=182803 RepID=A0A4Y2FIN3_ARAVE|nr:hypothetical protein AVEN_34225-1 [Araneus ventricosus]